MYHIKPYLRNKGYNLSKLAKKMNMSFQKFDHHIRPKEDLSYNFIKDLSGHLDLSIENFISHVKEEVAPLEQKEVITK
jgi:hypothetical protein|tara:strand:+ start:193 stop:426 length:234 start_codon:yes stop_codon:yes gene_type:complete